MFQGFWNKDFSAARNTCLKEVTGDWVLWLNAGEKLASQSATELREFIDSSADAKKAYLLMIEIPPADPQAAGEQISQPRLLPVNAGLKFAGRVRETLSPSIQSAGLEIDTAPGRILCHSRHHFKARKIQLAQRDLELVALELAETDEPAPRLFLAQGEAYSNLGAYDQAREAFSRAIELAAQCSTEMLEGYYGLLTCNNGDPALSEAQLLVCMNALEVFPFDAQLLLAMGNYLQMRGRLDLAARAFETAVKSGQTNPSTWHLCELPVTAASCLIMTLQLQGKNEEAGRALEEALHRHPQSARLPRLAVDLYIKQGKPQQAIEMGQRCGVISGEEDPLILAIRGACKATKQQWTFALAYLQSAYLFGCRDPLCLRWLAVTLLSNKRIDAAKIVLDEWQQLEPNHPELLAYLAAIQEKDAVSGTNAAEAESETTSTSRQYRIDPGAPLEISSLTVPGIDQAASTNTQLQGET